MKKIILLVGFGLAILGSVQAQNCPRYIGGDSTKTTAPYSIYREFFKKNLFADAMPEWRNIYANAPAFRKQTFLDGADMYISFIQKETDVAKVSLLTDTLFQIYDKYIQCFGEDAYILGRYATDLLKYGKDTDIPQARKLLEKNIQLTGDNIFYYYIQTYFKLLVNQLARNVVTADFVKQKYSDLSGIVDRNIAKPENKQIALYKDVKSTIDEIYNDLFSEKNLAPDCSKLEVYKKKFYENTNDIEMVKALYSNARNCGDSLFNVELLKKLNQLAPGYSYALALGSMYMKDKKFDSAFILYQNAISNETDSNKLANLYFIMANIKYESNDFPASREFSQKALVYNPSLGKAYLLIGTLYASSGKLCGPGTGFQSQIVLWPAFDNFKKAIEVGSDDVKQEAQKMLSAYTQYLPTKAEVTAKKLSVGGSYTVKCWINEATTVQVKSGGASNTPQKKN